MFVSGFQQKFSGNKIWGIFKQTVMRKFCERFSVMIFGKQNMEKS